MAWSNPTTFSEACCRAGGRRRYNATRQIQQQIRRTVVLVLMKQWGWTIGSKKGIQAKIAKHLQVSEATISRDIWAILRIK